MSRIIKFLNLEESNKCLKIVSTTSLFDNYLKHIKVEYNRYHQHKSPELKNFEIHENLSLNDTKYQSIFNQMKNENELPFSISQIYQTKTLENSFFKFPHHMFIKTHYFVHGSRVQETFYQLQRQHKIWWRQIGTSPGRYSISDQKSDAQGSFVKIRSNILEGHEAIDVERLGIFSLKDVIDKTNLTSFMCNVPNRKKDILPEVIESSIDLHSASLALLLDADQLSPDFLALHRRSAPYHIALIINGSNKLLISLARFIELLIRETEPSIEIFKQLEIEENCEKQLMSLDQIGIPYVIILDDKALENGLFKLRNRNTTLSEIIHLSNIPNYLIKIFGL